MRYELRIGLRYLRHSPGRTALLLAGITVGSAALVVALALMTGFHEDIRERILTGTAHLTVTHRFELTFEDADTLASEWQERDGVQLAATVLSSPAMLSGSEFSSPAYTELLGIEPRRYAEVIAAGEDAPPFELLDGPTPGSRPGILLGENLARRIGVMAGEPLTLIVPQLRLTPFGPVPRTHVLEVVGTFRSDFLQEDARRAYVTLPTLRRALKAGSAASYVELRLAQLERLDPIRDALRDELGGSWLVIDWIEANSDWLKALNLEKLTLFLAIGLILVVAAMNILSAQVLTVTSKTREIGILSAIGARPRGIAGIFICQGAIIGVSGALAGLSLGAVLSSLADRHRWIALDPEVYYLTHVPFAPTAIDMIGVGLITVLISVAATIYPARRAALLDPVEALRDG